MVHDLLTSDITWQGGEYETLGHVEYFSEMGVWIFLSHPPCSVGQISYVCFVQEGILKNPCKTMSKNTVLALIGEAL